MRLLILLIQNDKTENLLGEEIPSHFVMRVQYLAFLQIHSLLNKNKEKSFKVSDIRNKLSPITNLIEIIKNEDINNIDIKELLIKEIKQCEISIKYLTDEK